MNLMQVGCYLGHYLMYLKLATFLNSYSTKNMAFVPIKLLERISNRSSKCTVFVESVKKSLCVN